MGDDVAKFDAAIGQGGVQACAQLAGGVVQQPLLRVSGCSLVIYNRLFEADRAN